MVLRSLWKKSILVAYFIPVVFWWLVLIVLRLEAEGVVSLLWLLLLLALRLRIKRN